MSKPLGKVTIRLQDTTNTEFSEQPFYINANFMSDYPLSGIDSDTAITRFKNAIYDMCDLSTNTHISTKVTYEVNIV